MKYSLVSIFRSYSACPKTLWQTFNEDDVISSLGGLTFNIELVNFDFEILQEEKSEWSHNMKEKKMAKTHSLTQKQRIILSGGVWFNDKYLTTLVNI